jgi:glutathione synthase/RimK-type ligase-like ATP-grasp enzyme
MRPEVLVVTGLYDFSADAVVTQLRAMGADFIRINREQLPDLRLTVDPLEPSLVVRSAQRRFVAGPNLEAIWFRQPVFMRNTPPEALVPAEQLVRSQWAAFQRSLCVFAGARWMNHPQSTYLAECKPYQLAVASRCGFLLPATLVTNDADAVRARFDGPIVVKSLDTVLLREGKDSLFTYTTIGSAKLLNEDNTATAPLIAQEFVKGKTDLRVTIVGGRAFAVRILADGEGIEGDWRTIERARLSYENIKLDRMLEESCLRLTRELGLAFAAIDLVETDNGVFFIEVNPTGEWGWLSDETRPIAKAIAAWLCDAPHEMV